jgi:hypothetical protein
MPEVVTPNPGIECTIDPCEQVEIESCGNTTRVIVGALKCEPVFLHINANQQPAARAAEDRDSAEKILGFSWLEVPNRRTWKESNCPAHSAGHLRQCKCRGKVGAYRRDAELRIGACKSGRAS